MKIRNFKKFNESKYEKIFEQAINESIVYYSPRLRSILTSIKNSDISKELLEVEGNDIKNDITFIDIDDNRPDFLTFTRMAKAINNIESLESDFVASKLKLLQTSSNLSNSDYMFNNNSGNILKKDRNPIKLTKIVNKIIPNKFKASDIDEFSRKFMAKITKEDLKFRLVEGDEISFWYKKENYSEIKGELGNSCMKSSPSYYFDIYAKNPEVCKMLILLDGDEKLLGRAIIWKLSPNKTIKTDELFFMDRHYTIDSTDVQRFRDYATKNNWAFKTHNGIGLSYNVTYNNISYNMAMEVDITGEFDYFPYMDTFKRYSRSSDKLYNDDNDDSDNEGDYILSDTGGGFTEVNGGNWSEYDDEYIPEQYSVYSEVVDSYLHIDRSVEVSSGSRRYHGWYPDGHDDIVYINTISEYVHIDDSLYSEWYDDYILSDDTALAIVSIDSDGEPDGRADISEHDNDFYYYVKYNSNPWFMKISDVYSEWDDTYYLLKSLTFINYKKDISLNEFRINVYRITELSEEASKIGFTIENNVLSNTDALILKCKINKEEVLTTDLYDYNNDLEDFLQEYYNFLVVRYDEISSIINGDQKLIDFESNEEYLNKLKNLNQRIDGRIDEIKYSTYNLELEIIGEKPKSRT